MATGHVCMSLYNYLIIISDNGIKKFFLNVSNTHLKEQSPKGEIEGFYVCKQHLSLIMLVFKRSKNVP